MKRTLVIAVIVLLLCGTAYAKPFKSAIQRPGVSISTLNHLMKKGQVLIIDEKPDGSLDLVTAGIIIDAPPAEVYKTLVQFDKYAEYMPSAAGVEVVGEKDGKKLVKYDIEFKFLVLKFAVQYTMKQSFVKNREITWELESSKDGKLKSAYGAWQLHPAPGGKTAAFYMSFTDLKSVSWALRKTFEAEPSMEVSVNASSCLMVLKAVKKRVEDPTYSPNKKK